MEGLQAKLKLMPLASDSRFCFYLIMLNNTKSLENLWPFFLSFK